MLCKYLFLFKAQKGDLSLDASLLYFKDVKQATYYVSSGSPDPPIEFRNPKQERLVFAAVLVSELYSVFMWKKTFAHILPIQFPLSQKYGV